MSNSTQQTSITPARAGELLGVETYTIRRWCEWHTVHLSPGASPGAGALRRLTMRDVEVLRAVRDLRAQGLTTSNINEQLANMAFPEVNSTSEAIEAPQNEPESQQGAILPLQAIEHYQAIETRLALLERSAQTPEQARQEDRRLLRDGLTMFALGFIAALLFVILLLLLFLARHWL